MSSLTPVMSCSPSRDIFDSTTHCPLPGSASCGSPVQRHTVTGVTRYISAPYLGTGAEVGHAEVTEDQESHFSWQLHLKEGNCIDIILWRAWQPALHATSYLCTTSHCNVAIMLPPSPPTLPTSDIPSQPAVCPADSEMELWKPPSQHTHSLPSHHGQPGARVVGRVLDGQPSSPWVPN